MVIISNNNINFLIMIETKNWDYLFSLSMF